MVGYPLLRFAAGGRSSGHPGGPFRGRRAESEPRQGVGPAPQAIQASRSGSERVGAGASGRSGAESLEGFPDNYKHRGKGEGPRAFVFYSNLEFFVPLLGLKPILVAKRSNLETCLANPLGKCDQRTT